MAKCGGNSQKKGGDEMLVGEFQHNIDAKGRMIMPAKFRDELGEKFVITKGLDKCLFVFSCHILFSFNIYFLLKPALAVLSSLCEQRCIMKVFHVRIFRLGTISNQPSQVSPMAFLRLWHLSRFASFYNSIVVPHGDGLVQDLHLFPLP